MVTLGFTSTAVVIVLFSNLPKYQTPVYVCEIHDRSNTADSFGYTLLRPSCDLNIRG